MQQEPVQDLLQPVDGRGVHPDEEAVLAGDAVALGDLRQCRVSSATLLSWPGAGRTRTNAETTVRDLVGIALVVLGVAVHHGPDA